MFDTPADRDERDEFYRDRYDADGVRVTQQMIDDEFEFAEKRLADRDFERGLNALAVALIYQPHRPEFTSLLHMYFDTDPAAAAGAVGYQPFAPYEAGQALGLFAAHHRGDHADALRRVTEMARNLPNLDLPEVWGLPWMTDEVVRQQPQMELVRFFAAFVNNRYGEADTVTEFGRELLGRAVERIELVERVHGRNDTLTLLKCQMLSKAGRGDEAVAEAEAQAERSPSFNTCTAAGMAHKRAGRIEQACDWFRRASQLDATNETGMLDVGDLMIDAGKYRVALEAYEEALRRVPNHDWAEPSAAYCRYMISKSPDDLATLRDMAHGPRCTCGCAGALKNMMGGYNYEDRQRRAEVLMRLVEPDFAVPRGPTAEAVDDEGEDEE